MKSRMFGPTPFFLLFFAFAALLFSGFTSSSVLAHSEHGGKDHHDGKNHHACEKYISKTEAPVLDFNSTKWRLVEKIEQGSFRYVFFHDTTRPEIVVAAMVVRAKLVGSDSYMTRVSWQVGDKIRSVRVELDEMVCENPIVTKDGKTYDLKGLMDRLTKNK